MAGNAIAHGVKHALVVAVCTALGACAGNPYIGDTRPAPPTGRVAPKVGTMAYALDYLDDTSRAYQAKISAEWDRQQGVSSALLFLGGLIAGNAASSERSHRVAGLALAGATGFAIANWNTNPGRTAIYREGQRALSCVREAVSRLDKSEEYFTQLKSHAKELKKTQDDVAAKQGALMKALIPAKAAEGTRELVPVRTAESELAAANQALVEANAAAERAAALRGRIDTAATAVTGTVVKINNTVETAIDNTTATLAGLGEALRAIPGHMNLFIENGANLIKPKTPIVQGDSAETNKKGSSNLESSQLPGPDGKSSSMQRELANATGNLQESRAKLSSAVARINGALAEASVTSEQIAAALKKCNTDVSDQLTPPFSLVGSRVVEFREGVADRVKLVVRGGTKRYTAEFDRKVHKGLEVEIIGENALVIHAGTDTEGGTRHTVLVHDSTPNANPLSVEVNVTAKKQEADKSGADKNKPENKAAAAVTKCNGQQDTTTWTRENVCLLQKVINVPVDGNFGDKSCTSYVSGGADALGNQGVPFAQATSGLVNNETLAALYRKIGLGWDPRPSAESVAKKATEVGCPSPGTPLQSAKSGPPTPSQPKPPPAGIAAGGELDTEKLKKLRAQLQRYYRPSLPLEPAALDPQLQVVVTGFQRDCRLPQSGQLDAATVAAIDKLPQRCTPG